MISNTQIFRILCFISAICLCIYCMIEFSNNSDLSEVSFKKFNGDDKDMNPQVTICFVNQYSEYELKSINPRFTSDSYENFLKGSYWDDAMMDLNIEKITTKLEDHVLQTCVQSAYGGSCNTEIKIEPFVTFFGTKCISFRYMSTKRINSATMWINSSIFLNTEIRPAYGFKFTVAFSYPNQLYRGSNQFGQWPVRNKRTDMYTMGFNVMDVEVLRRRDKINNPCSDWRSYDTYVQNEVMANVGCRPFNLSSMQNYPPCADKEKWLFLQRFFMPK